MKRINKFLSCVLALGLMASCAACGPKIDGDFDDKANNIYIQVYTGGVGSAWLNDVVKEFNQKYDSEVSSEKWVMNVLTTNNKDDGANFYEAFKSGTSSADIYFTSNPTMWPEMISNNYLLDLSDVYASKPDGESGKTVSQKLANANEGYNKLYTNYGKANGIYGLPYAELVMGMIVNKETFVKNGWFTAADVSEKEAIEQALGCSLKTATYQMRNVLVRSDVTGAPKYSDIILTAGKDGKYGTVDDGQPVNVTEWNDMMDAISSANYKAFLWSGKYPGYTNAVLSGIFGQYMGEENMRKWLMFGDEEYSFTDGSGKEVTVNSQTRAESYKVPELKKALDFFSSQVVKNAHSKSLTGNETHIETQGSFIYGETSSTMEKAAILCDGSWWENEARTKLEAVGGYNKNEYTFLYAPAFEGQKMAATDSYMPVTEAGSVFARNTKDEAKAAKIKEFLSMTCSDKYLKHFTSSNGCIRPFEYSLSEEELSKLTPFARNCWEIYHSENIHIVNTALLLNIGKSSVSKDCEYYFYADRNIYQDPVSALIKNVSADKIYSGMYEYAKNSMR